MRWPCQPRNANKSSSSATTSPSAPLVDSTATRSAANAAGSRGSSISIAMRYNEAQLGRVVKRTCKLDTACASVAPTYSGFVRNDFPRLLTPMPHPNTFGSRATLTVDGRDYTIYRLGTLGQALPVSLRILLENLLRNEDGAFVKPADIETLSNWDVTAGVEREIAFFPSRVLLQDFTGVPAIVDLAAMREAIPPLGGAPTRINPLQPVDLVVDHSVQVDEYGNDAAFLINTQFEYERNRERYAFLRWGQTAFDNFRVVPPETGICHQVNLEYLSRVVFARENTAYPDSLVGTDSHTTMVNGLSVLGWGVGGIEAEAAMLGQPLSMLIP